MRLNISEMNLLRVAASEALSRYRQDQLTRRPRERLLPLFRDVMAHASKEATKELAGLLLAFYEVDEDSEREPTMNVFECRNKVSDPEEWVDTFSLHNYALSIVVEVVARYMFHEGGYERPAHLAPRSRGRVPSR